MVTFGDMMSLLLCFFVILVSMSEIKEEERFEKVKESIKRAFGYRGGTGHIPGMVPPNNTYDKQMQELIMRKWQLQIGKSTDEGIEGENPSVKTIRDGIEFTVGGKVAFEPGKAKLLDPAKKQLSDFASLLLGLNTKIKIQGHAARKPPAEYRGFDSLDDLSYARGREVKKYFVSLGIKEARMTVEACGDNEPERSQAYDEKARADNRRVTIIVTESLIEDYQGEPVARTANILDG